MDVVDQLIFRQVIIGYFNVTTKPRWGRHNKRYIDIVLEIFVEILHSFTLFNKVLIARGCN